MIAAEAEHLTVFQRTPNYSIPARNGPIDLDYARGIKAEYPAFRARNRRMHSGFGSKIFRKETPALEDDPAEREATYADRWKRGGLSFLGAYNDLLVGRDANETAADFVRGRIRAIVKDPRVAELMCPDNVIGCKRPCLDTRYFETYNRSNVELVDARTHPIERITPDGVVVKVLSRETGDTMQESSRKIALDRIVFATGFDAMTGAVLGVDIRGRGGQTLREKWSEGPCTYLGLGTAGFPNLFLITGPGSPSVLTNMMVSIEQHVDWISDWPGAPAPREALDHRGDRRSRGCLGGPRQRGRRPNALSDLQLVVPGQEHSRQTAGVHAADRLPALCGEVRGGRCERLRRVCAALKSISKRTQA